MQQKKKIYIYILKYWTPSNNFEHPSWDPENPTVSFSSSSSPPLLFLSPFFLPSFTFVLLKHPVVSYFIFFIYVHAFFVCGHCPSTFWELRSIYLNIKVTFLYVATVLPLFLFYVPAFFSIVLRKWEVTFFFFFLLMNVLRTEKYLFKY